MSMLNECLKNSPAIISPQKHNCIFSPTDAVVRKVSNISSSSSSSQVPNTHSYPPFNAPLLVVSPTSPVGTPSRLPVVVPRQISKQVAPVINCTSWLNSEEVKNTTVDQHVSSGQPSLSRKEDLQILTTSQKPGFRGSKIPVRSARGSNNHGLIVYPTPCASRSKSLTNLTTDDFSSTSADFRYQQFDTSSQKSFQHRASPSFIGNAGSSSSHHQIQAPKPRSQGFPAPASTSRPQLRQLSTSSSNLSLSSLQSPPSPSSVYRFSPRVVRRSCEEPPKASHEPYETPQYFTFHLTLRSPAKSPSRQSLRPVSRCCNNNSFGSSHTKASLAATRCVEDMILQTCAVPSPEMLQTVRLPHSIHMPQVPSCEISIESDSDYKGENDLDSESVTTSRNPRNEEEEEEEAEHKQRHMINEDCVNMNNNKDSSAGSNKSLSSQATTVPSPFELGSIEDIHCLSFGIVDYLNAVMKFQDSEKDETESNCSDCGSGLTISPPTRLSDNDSAIEPLPVSSDAPLKGNQSPRPSSSLPRNKPDIRNMKWRSSQELMTRPTKRRLLQRQLSDLALRSRLQERNLQGTSVQVYDGNIGVSVITLPRSNRSSAPLRKPSRRCLSAMDKHLASHFSPQRSCDSPRADRRLVHEESGDSIEYGYHDSLIAEPSDTEFGEQMDIDENVDENAFHSTDSPPQVNSGSPDSLSKRSDSRSEKRNTSGGRFHGKTGQNFGTNMKFSSTNKPVKEGVVLSSSSSSSKLDLLAEPEIDRVLGILEDDGMGPGLSEDEMNTTDSPPTNCVHPSPRGVGGMISPHKIIWYLQESRRRSNESAIRRMQPLPVHHETASANAPKYIRADRDGSLRNVSVSDTSQPASAVRRSSRQQQVRQYSESSQYDSSAEESDTGAELSELERCVLSLTHRRSQLRKQDTNAYLIAPPEYKIGDEVSTVLEDS
ncbi:uncharacterized protein LOC135217099 isoform X2 [Macrobrachium nipponense]|uniref:uncharacterized protein LOC135217099 isoform X2 n=1 Tax=Macrobrachium nipponense TaxID=159736 RepID=UPI0030C7CCBA